MTLKITDYFVWVEGYWLCRLCKNPEEAFRMYTMNGLGYYSTQGLVEHLMGCHRQLPLTEQDKEAMLNEGISHDKRVNEPLIKAWEKTVFS